MLIPEKLRETIEGVLIKEAPLPDEWDKDIYNEKVPFKRRIEYAKSMATRLGAGSSRVAFEIPYQGRKTVLKIAKNKKGIAQNEEEARVLSDVYIKSAFSEWILPIIDYDEENPGGPTWVHVEYADKIKSEKQFTEIFNLDGLSITDFVYYAEYVNNPSRWSATRIQNTEKQIRKLSDENQEKAWDLIQVLNVLQNDFGVYLADFNYRGNWGIYKGHPVMIDIGLTPEVYTKYYKR